MIFSDSFFVENSEKTYVQFQNHASFWQQCSEDDINLQQGAGCMDPVLKLYEGCCVMLPCNTKVKEGQANGTQATIKK
jgi:hypothetical protein